MKGLFPIDRFQNIPTPFYYYDTALLRQTLDAVKQEAEQHGFVVHYAVKANANAKILSIISSYGLGADCVSGGEIEASLEAGFPARRIVFAGVGKSDWEIELALRAGIFCFNVESKAELEVINELADKMGTMARVCLRINPNVDAHTHASITTGLAENKFGIAMETMDQAVSETKEMSHVDLIGLHFHIGSQILDLEVYRNLCHRVNELQDRLEAQGITLKEINVGGGLGIDYDHPDDHPVAQFKEYFDIIAHDLKLRHGQRLHFELGRAIVAQMGTLIARTLYVKQGTKKQFAILDAGMTDLIRPALYQAHHKIENLSSHEPEETYDVVGPICESSDVFDKNIRLARVHRGDLVAIRSAGAYGEVMASQYNCRKLPQGYTSDEWPEDKGNLT